MKRTLQIDLPKAREWYTSSNKALKELALQVFSEEELTFSYENLIEKEQLTEVTIPVIYKEKTKVLNKLAILARYFNTKHASVNRRKYFIVGQDGGTNCVTGSHESVTYPGIIYFNREADIHEAIQELSEQELSILFKKY
jgi:hypothetical protein